MRARLLLGLALLLSSCAKAPKVTGVVTDLFGKPVDGALVVVVESNERTTSDGTGRFTFETERGRTLHLKGGHEGFVASVVEVTIPADKKAEIPEARLELWPDPKEPGFYGRGTLKMIPFPAAHVVAFGTDLREIRGVRDLPKTLINTGVTPAQIQFKSTLRSQEISRLDLTLNELTYVETTPIPGIMGEQQVNAQMWVAGKEIPFELRAMEGADVYLVTTKETLSKGVYAFQYQNILSNSENGTLEKIPTEMRTVFPFEIR